jgi:benzoate transport
MSEQIAQSPQEVIDAYPMCAWQIAAVAVTILLNALDGFDVLSISFAAPGIADEWGLKRDALGWVLSMELIGMAAGSILLGGAADRYGRRPTILACLMAMTLGMYMVSGTSSITELSIWRVITGLGIGGMLAAINAVVAEFSSRKWRNVSLSLMVIGYPLGAVGGGLVARQLVEGGDWRSIFVFGAAATAAFIPLVLIFIPESPAFLAEKRPPNALQRINRTFTRFGLPNVSVLAPFSETKNKNSMFDIFRPSLIRTTLLVTFAYFTHVSCYYFFMKWIPKIAVDLGFDASSAADILIWAMLGGATGGAVYGVLTHLFGIKPVTIGALLGSFVMVSLFGRTAPDLQMLALVAGITGFFINGAAVAFYVILARAFPVHVRASGTGFGIGTGRAGAVVGPALAGILFASGTPLASVMMLMATGSLLAAVAIYFLKLNNAEEPETDGHLHA